MSELLELIAYCVINLSTVDGTTILREKWVILNTLTLARLRTAETLKKNTCFQK